MQFSLDRKRRSHKQNQCSASDSVGLIFTRSYRFTLLIKTPTTTPSLVKTSLYSLSHRKYACAHLEIEALGRALEMLKGLKGLGVDVLEDTDAIFDLRPEGPSLRAISVVA